MSKLFKGCGKTEEYKGITFVCGEGKWLCDVCYKNKKDYAMPYGAKKYQDRIKQGETLKMIRKEVKNEINRELRKIPEFKERYRKYHITYYSKNKEKINRRQRERLQRIKEDPEKWKEFVEKRKIYQAKYSPSPEALIKKRERKKIYYLKNRDKLLAKARAKYTKKTTIKIVKNARVKRLTNRQESLQNAMEVLKNIQEESVK
jgi:hypothetical protein